MFDGLNNESINNKIFFASVLIYTGAIVFDLIFLCIETNAKVGKLMTGIYCGSVFLAVVNTVICIVELVGAMGGLDICLTETEQFVVKITECGLTKVFPNLLLLELKISIGMIVVLLMGMLSILPGLLMVKLRDLKQEKD